MRSIAKVLAVLLVVFCISADSYTQTIDTIWTANHWRDYYDSVTSIIQTADGGFIMSGATIAQGSTKFNGYVLKTDSEGQFEWDRVIGYDNSNEYAYDILQTDDGGYIVTAQSDSLGVSHLDYRIWVMKLDASGDSVWNWRDNVTGASGHTQHLIQTFDSGFAMTGIIYEPGLFANAFLLRLDKDGNYVDYDHYGNGAWQDGNYLTQMDDSGFVIIGNDSDPDYVLQAIRTDKYGALQWDSSYSITPSYDYVYGTCRTDDGFVMTGLAQGAGHVYKIDFDGNTVWSKPCSNYPTSEQNYDIVRASSGGYMVGGWRGVVGKYRDYCFIRLDDAGDTLWSFTVGGPDNDHGHCLVATDDGNFVLVGESHSFVNGGSIYMVKIGEVPSGIADELEGELPETFKLYGNYPNPFNPTTTIAYSVPHRTRVKLAIYNILGQQVDILVDEEQPPGPHTVEWNARTEDGTQLPSGVYIYRLSSEGYKQTQKMVLMK